MANIDFSPLNALAASIGEEALVEMALAYVSYVKEKKSGISPKSSAWNSTPLAPVAIKGEPWAPKKSAFSPPSSIVDSLSNEVTYKKTLNFDDVL